MSKIVLCLAPGCDHNLQAKRAVANSTDFLRIAIGLQNGNHAADKLVL